MSGIGKEIRLEEENRTDGVFHDGVKLPWNTPFVSAETAWEGESLNTEIAIIGNGCAARKAMETVRQSGFRGRVDVFSDSGLPAYNPMLTTYYLGGKIPYEDLLLHKETDRFYEKYEIDLHLNTPIVRLDPDKKILWDREGNPWNYGQCLIAAGASPVIPSMEGGGEEGVFVLRTAEDALRIKNYMESHRIGTALVVGASMVGIKVAEFLLQEKISCCLADGGKGIFPLAAHPNCQALIENEVKRKGLKLRFGGNITRITRDGKGLLAFFSDSEEPVAADIIFLCIGVRPNLSFLNPEQVAVKGGILVDPCMRTSCKDLYAAGDCTAGHDVFYGDNRIIGLLSNARFQGRTAGRNMAEGYGTEVYCGSTGHNITHFMGMDFVSMGNPLAEGRVFEKYLKGGRYIRLVWDEGRLLSVNLLNAKEIAGVLKNLFLKTGACFHQQEEDFLDYGEFSAQLIKKYMNE